MDGHLPGRLSATDDDARNAIRQPPRQREDLRQDGDQHGVHQQAEEDPLVIVEELRERRPVDPVKTGKDQRHRELQHADQDQLADVRTDDRPTVVASRRTIAGEKAAIGGQQLEEA